MKCFKLWANKLQRWAKNDRYRHKRRSACGFLTHRFPFLQLYHKCKRM